MALKIDEVMDLSLDDYIAISSKTSSNKGATSNDSSYETGKMSTGSNDAKFGRRKGNIDGEEEDEDDDFATQNLKEEVEENRDASNNDTGIWKGPDSSISYLDFNNKHNDLREKLNRFNNRGKGEVTSVQYRLKAPNNSANRPLGIPTLLPLDAYVNRNNGRNNNRRQNANRFKNSCNFQRGSNNRSNFFSQPSHNLGINNFNSGRIQRGRKQEVESKNLRFFIRHDNAVAANATASPKHAQNMIVETPSSCISLNPSAPLNSSFQVPHSNTSNVRSNSVSKTIPFGNITPQVEAKLNLNSATSSNSNNDSLKSLLGFQGNVSGDMMPVFANRLLDFIQSGLQTQVHKPIYDMKIQRDIHEIQGKPLLYKCPGGEVVSSDGAGVNCKIIPRTSGVSLNCRFA